MTAQDTYVNQRESEVDSLRREVRRLREENKSLQERVDLAENLQHFEKLKVGPPQHPGQMTIGEEAK